MGQEAPSSYSDSTRKCLSVDCCTLEMANVIDALHYLAGRDWGQEEKGTTEDEIAGWHH